MLGCFKVFGRNRVFPSPAHRATRYNNIYRIQYVLNLLVVFWNLKCIIHHLSWVKVTRASISGKKVFGKLFRDLQYGHDSSIEVFQKDYVPFV